jgi:hypothetical protein
MIAMIGLADPKMRVILNQWIARVQEVKHSEQPILTALFHLVCTHNVGMFRANLPKETELDYGQLAAAGELGFK